MAMKINPKIYDLDYDPLRRDKKRLKAGPMPRSIMVSTARLMLAKFGWRSWMADFIDKEGMRYEIKESREKKH